MKTRILMIAMAALLLTSVSYAADNSSKKEGHVVHSVIDGRNTMTAYDKKGKWVYTIQQYDVNQLDKDLIRRIKPVYYDYTITAVQKVEQPGKDAVYIVHLENEDSIKTIRMTDDETETVQDIVKG